ncbi:MAG: hypothetical protein OCD76_07210 [Reichenbachiella sp.]
MKTTSSSLLELRYGTKFKLLDEATVPPAAPEGSLDMVFTFGSIDGMYSWSTGEDGERYYFAAWTEVEVIS